MTAFKDLEKKKKLIESNLSLGSSPITESAPSIKPVTRSMKPPLNSTVEKLEHASSNVLPDRLSEWEKSNFEKLFKSMDDFAKTKTIKRDSLLKLFDIMQKDDTFLGKVPVISKDEFIQKVALRLKDKKNSAISPSDYYLMTLLGGNCRELRRRTGLIRSTKWQAHC